MTYGDPPETPPGRPGPAGNLPIPTPDQPPPPGLAGNIPFGASFYGIEPDRAEADRFEMIRRQPYITAAEVDPYQHFLAAQSYEYYKAFPTFLTKPAADRVLMYAEIATQMLENPEMVAQRSKRLLAWGIRNDNEALNVLQKRGENNWFQVGNWLQGAVLWDELIPGDMNAVTSSEAKYIEQVWADNPVSMDMASSLLTPEALEALQSVDPYFADQYQGSIFGDEEYVDQEDGYRPAEVSAYYMSTGYFGSNVLEDLSTALDWTVLAGLAGAAWKLASTGAKQGVKAVLPAAARGVAGVVPGTMGLVGNLTDRQIAAWHLSRMGKWATAAGGKPQLLGETWRTTGRRWTAAYLGSAFVATGAQSAYDLWIRDVTPADIAVQETNERAVRANIEAAWEEGSLSTILPHRILADSIALIQAQIASATPPTVGAPPSTDPDDPASSSATGAWGPGLDTTTGTTPPGGYTSTGGEITASAPDWGATPEAGEPAPAPYYGGMPDQYVRDADGNIATDPETGLPLKADAYTRPGPTIQGPMGIDFPTAGHPQYRMGDATKMLSAMTPAQIASLTSQLSALGVNIGTVSPLGSLNTLVVTEFERLLADANWNATTWEAQLTGEVLAMERQQREADALNQVAYARFSYLPPDYDTLAQEAKDRFRTKLGRDPTQAEITLYGDAFTNVDKAAQRQGYRMQRASDRQSVYDQQVAAGEQPTKRVGITVPVEDPSTGGITPGPGGLTKGAIVDRPARRPPGPGAPGVTGGRQVDVEASMAEWFERRYGGEEDLRVRINEDARNFATMMSGSNALTNRVRAG